MSKLTQFVVIVLLVALVGLALRDLNPKVSPAGTVTKEPACVVYQGDKVIGFNLGGC